MSNQDCNCQQSEQLKIELKQTKSERDNAEETWDKERKMYQAACVERDEARAEAALKAVEDLAISHCESRCSGGKCYPENCELAGPMSKIKTARARLEQARKEGE